MNTDGIDAGIEKPTETEIPVVEHTEKSTEAKISKKGKMADGKEDTVGEDEDMEELELPQDVGITHNTLFVTPNLRMRLQGNLQERLSNFNGSRRADPTIDGHFRKHLSSLCSRQADPAVALDNGSASSFDSHYYRNLESGKGLLYVDQALMAAPVTSSIVDLYASNQELFYRDFSLAMVKLFNLNVLTGKQEQIRKECSKLVNGSGRSRKPVIGKLKLLWYSLTPASSRSSSNPSSAPALASMWPTLYS
ncbi:peroxidase 35-like [Cryptomeria japonica]|uniref:peroxidase 35-like n=1 Tax=Cryptomeria japonica TaxID=3369 RepID=UPI0027DA0B6D|nr:peroxidase 35-like [Cryptomeria japonica]